MTLKQWTASIIAELKAEGCKAATRKDGSRARLRPIARVIVSGERWAVSAHYSSLAAF